MGEDLRQLSVAADLLRSARSIVVFTGAGVSAESGIPTYRSGSDGLWSAQNMERFANPSGYARNLPESYEWYRARALTALDVQPNAAHRAIAALTTARRGVTLVTQNIDSLHQRAGSADVIELHGNLRECRCEACGWRVPWASAPGRPSCPECTGTLRPDVVMFDEMLPAEALEAAFAAARTADVMMVVGTSLQVAPASELPRLALRAGGRVIVVNPDEQDGLTGPGVVRLPGKAGQVLPPLVASATLAPSAEGPGAGSPAS